MENPKLHFQAFLKRLTTERPGFLPPEKVDELLHWFGIAPDSKFLSLCGAALNIVHYPTMQTLWLSKEHEKLTGYSIAELHKDNMYSYISKIHPEDLKRLNEGFVKEKEWVSRVGVEKLHRANLTFNYRFVRADGRVISILHNTYHFANGSKDTQPEYSLSVLQDISAVKKDCDIHFTFKIWEEQTKEMVVVGHEQIGFCLALTDKELQILHLTATGEGNKQIALKLDIVEQTVKNHKYTMFKKVGVRNMVELVVLAKERGWL